MKIEFYESSCQAGEPNLEYQKLNEQMNLAYQFIESTDVSVFLTGKAGTGKTTFLHKLRKLLPKRMVVLAPTGVAAINAGGQTIHSFFQLPFGPWVPGGMAQKDNKSYKMSEKKKDLIRTLDLLVIDEVSMVRADLLDQVDDALRKYRDKFKPFGGVQLLLIGDLMQLSPVAKEEEWGLLSSFYQSPFFFSSRALQKLQFVTVELKHIYRQEDLRFIKLLGQVRSGYITPEVMETLNSRYVPDFRPLDDDWIRLTTHNYAAQKYNDECMAALPGTVHTFSAKVSGNFPETSFPADQELVLKEGAQVMFVKNDPSYTHQYYNGLIGTVMEFTPKGIVVSVENNSREILVAPVDWENTRYELNADTKEIKETVDGVFTQYPLRLAWAITVHKSQGLTFDHAVLDINASFTHGQVYVALSRCRTLEGLVLANPIAAGSVITDGRVNSFIEREAAAAEEYERQLPDLKQQYLLSLLDELYDFRDLQKAWQLMMRIVDEYLSRQQPELLQSFKELEGPFGQRLSAVADRFRKEYMGLLTDTEGLQDRIKASAHYFYDTLIALFTPISQRVTIKIDNKAVLESYNRALSGLRKALYSKMYIFDKLQEEKFDALSYLQLRAQAELGKKPKELEKESEEQKPRREKRRVKDTELEPKKPKVDTLNETLRLYREGKSCDEIARERNLKPSTIETHLSKLVERGDIEANELVSPDRQETIREVINRFTESYSLSAIKEKLPEDYTYGEIKVVIGLIEREEL